MVNPPSNVRLVRPSNYNNAKTFCPSSKLRRAPALLLLRAAPLLLLRWPILQTVSSRKIIYAIPHHPTSNRAIDIRVIIIIINSFWIWNFGLLNNAVIPLCMQLD